MGFRLKFDFSVITYADENDMILLTRDGENLGGCMENQIPCVQLDESPSNDEIIEKLKKFEILP